jgi:hypothetical protein
MLVLIYKFWYQRIYTKKTTLSWDKKIERLSDKDEVKDRNQLFTVVSHLM